MRILSLGLQNEVRKQGGVHLLSGHINQHAKALANRFCRKSPARFLLEGMENPSVEDSLEAEIRRALSYSIRLWTRRSDITTMGIKQLPGFDERIMEAYPPQSPEQKSTSGGSSIAVVVQPAILAFGEDDYQASTKHAVWLKAAVVVNDRAE